MQLDRILTSLSAALVIAIGIVGAAGAASAQPHRLACPAESPGEWGIPKHAPLDQPAVLSQPTGVPIDDRSPPSLVPDRGYARGYVRHNIWLMGDDPGWSHFADCRYRGFARIPQLPANGLKQCEQTAQPYDPSAGVRADTTQTLVCD